MNALDNLKVAYKILIPLAAFFLGFVTFGVLSYETLRLVQVKGPLYNNVVQGKDLIADILPPPEYILEAYLNCHQMISEQDPQVMSNLMGKAIQLKSDFDTRHDYWNKNLTQDKLSQTFLLDSYTPAIEFFRIRDEQFIPAVKRGDINTAKRLLDGPMKHQYNIHRTNIDKVVQLASIRNAKDEAAATNLINKRTNLMIGIAAFMACISLFAGILSARNLVGRIQKLCAVLNRVAIGDLSNQTSAKQRAA